MGEAFLYGAGGGAALNYKVVGGTSEPAAPSENTIWINTNATITGHVFSATEPESPSEGMVWISTGTDSEVAFSATKENPIMLYPMSAAQYISGTWVAVSAKSYQNGSWVNWIRYLYNTGNECEEITGGWVSKALSYSSTATSTATAPTVTRNSANMVIKMSTESGSGIVYTKNKIDLTAYNTLRFKGTMNGSTTSTRNFYLRIDVWSAIGSNGAENRVTTLTTSGTITGERVLDVSELTGEYYIGFSLYTNVVSLTMEYLRLE